MDTSQWSFTRRLRGHWRTINHHRHLVRKLCFRLGLYKQGLCHDLSKYSPTEFWAGVRYYQGDRSPIEKEKKVLGYSMGWLHHKGRNPHHWEYWIDRSLDGKQLICYPMPKKYVKEMVCDRVAACMTYQKEKYTDHSALDYFTSGSDAQFMNPDSAALLTKYLTWIAQDGLDRAFEKIRND